MVVVSKLINGGIATAGIFYTNESEDISPERVGLFMMTLGIAFYYVAHTLQIPTSDLETVNGYLVMPDLPDQALYLFGGGQGTYIGGKFIRINKGILQNVRW